MKLCILALFLLAPAAARADDRERHFVSPGEPRPTFRLQTLSGGSFSSSQLANRPHVIAFVKPGNENSMSLLRDLRRLGTRHADESLPRVLVFSGVVDRESIRDMVGEGGSAGTVVLDRDRSVAASFRVVAVPSVAVVDGSGKVAWSKAGYGVAVWSRLARAADDVLGGSAAPEHETASRSSPRVQLARRLVELGKLQQAEKLLEAEVEREGALEAYLSYGELLIRIERPGKALDVLEAAREAHPEAPRLDVLVGRALASQGKIERAVRTLREVVRAAPATWEAHVALAEIFEAGGNKDAAIAEYKRAIAILSSPWKSDRD